uniref:Retrovirus-related Pol polyprotein from transposon TNT 1-94 n=1 Tax=Tanacetum cinerariifolium TaxID=118510 RepID=A0A6L2LXQ1_TANCI|nr:retrovirus-related Pol polyprotein from transposon TNT 1-94 [Tanacetum cinerariifolium]
MQMLYCFVNNIHVDYAELLLEGFHYSLQNPTTMIPYLRFTKLIVSHYMTAFPEISRRACDTYHNLEDDVMIKRIFNSGKSKNVVGMNIPDWMITDEMKLMENYWLYAEVFGVDVPTTQSQPIESTQGMHRKNNTLRNPNLEISEGESSAPQRSTVIKLHIPPRRSARLTSPTTIPTTDEADDLQVKEHLMAEEIEKLVEGSENVKENFEVVSSPLRNDDNQTNIGTRLEPRSDKESPKVENIAEISQPVNVIEEEVESADDDYELKRREKRKCVEEIRNTPSPTIIRSPKIQSTLVVKMIADAIQQEHKNFRSEISLQVNDAITNHIPSQVDSSVRSYLSRHVLYVHPTQATQTTAQEQQHQLYLTMNQLIAWLALKYKFKRLHMATTPCRPSAVRPRDQDDPRDDAHHERNNSAKRQKTSEHGTFVFGESLSGQDYESEPGPLTSEIVTRRANGCIVSITESDYKNLNKNDIEDMYPLIINHKVDDYAETGLLWSLSVFIRSMVIWERVHDFQLGVESYQQQVNLSAPTITFPGIEKYKVFSIVFEPVYGIIYKNNKKENRVMRYQEEIEERLKYRDQMRRWEIFEGPSNTKENMIMDLKLEYQTFKAKTSESISQTYTRYNTLLNELSNDDVNLSKHEINVGFVNSLPEKWLPRNANHTQTLDLADIYGRFVYEDNLIQRRYSYTKKALITTPSSTAISTAFSSNNVIQDFQENFNDEIDKRSSEEYLRDLEIKFHDPSTFKTLNTFQPKNKCLVAETFDWDKEEVSNDKEVTEVKVLMALADDELTVGKNHAHNDEWIDITIRKVNILHSKDEDADLQNYLKLNPDSKLLNFNTGRILVPESQVVNESLKPTETSTNLESSKDSKVESITPLPLLEILQGASPSSEEDHKTLDHEMYTASLKRSKNYKAQPYQYAFPSKQILKAKVKPFPPCTHYDFNDHRPDDCKNHPECDIYRIYDHFTLGHNHVIHIRGGVLAEFYQSSESSIGVSVIHVEALYTLPLTMMNLITLKEVTKFRLQRPGSSPKSREDENSEEVQMADYEAFHFDLDPQKDQSSDNFLYHNPSIGPPSIVEMSDSLLEKFTDELSHAEPFPPGFEGDDYDPKSEQKELNDFLDRWYPIAESPLRNTIERVYFLSEEFTDEFAHIISPSEYDHFHFDMEADPRELTRLLNGNLSSENINVTKIMEDNELKSQTSTEEPKIHELNILHLIFSISDLIFFEDSSEIDLLLLFPSGNENKVFNPEILMIDEVHSFMRKSSNVLNKSFKIVKRQV